MDTELARTFLGVVAAGNFSQAASHLFITQSTVSARIASLEEQLGCRLFVRNKAGAILTPAGHRFQNYATTLVRTVEHARQEIGIIRGFRAAVRIGGRFGLWEGLLLECLPRIRKAVEGVAVRAEIGFEDDLMQGLMEARMDMALMYAPQRRPGLVVDQVLVERLVYVSSSNAQSSVLDDDYVYVDWGPEFASQHSAAFPEFDGAGISANIGWLGLQHLLANKGSGYFPLRLVQNELDCGQLIRRGDLPEFELPVYIVHPEDIDLETGGLAVEIIRATTAEMHSLTSADQQ